MRATFKLLNSYFWKTIYGPIMVLLFPSVLLIIMGNIMRIEYILPGIIALVTMLISVQVMPLGIMELKNSTLFKYIGSTPVNPKRFIISVIAYYIFLIFAAIIVVVLVSMCAFYNRVFPGNGTSIYSGLATTAGGLSFVMANFIHMIMSLSIGLFIAVFAKTPQQSLSIGVIILLPSMFLSGMIISVDIISQSTAMQWVSRLIPFRYTTGNIIVSMTPLNQIGDFMDVIHDDPEKSLAMKGLIFNIVAIQDEDINKFTFLNGKKLEGLILLLDGKSFIDISEVDIQNRHISNYILLNKVYTITDINAKMIELNWNSSSINHWFSANDSTLFKAIFEDKNGALISADNNMFDWLSSFGVRKIPDNKLILNFMTRFFEGNKSEDNNTERFLYVWENFIQKNNFSFLDLFMKQNVLLYTKIERVLSFVLPITLTFGLTVWSDRKFQWASR